MKVAGVGVLAITFLPRMAFAAPNKLQGLRSGAQPGNKTRLVVETSARPSYSLEYLTDPARLVVNLSNTAGDNGIKPALAAGTLIGSISQEQSGDRLRVIATLTKPISEIPKSQILLLEPNGDSGFRLALDFSAGGAAAAATASSSAAASKSQSKARKPVIVVDAGHGGKDPGAISRNGTKEKDIVLRVARKLKTKLDAEGYRTFLTRDKDIFLNLDTRAGIAEKNHADLFISLHANANPSRQMRGFSVYTLSKKASDEEAQKLADAENAADRIEVDGFAKFEPNIRNALSALQQHAVSELSVEFANGVTTAFNRANIVRQPGPTLRQAPFAVLRSTIPGALVELGHLSHAEEEKLLKTDAHQDKLASAIVRAIGKYNFDV